MESERKNKNNPVVQQLNTETALKQKQVGLELNTITTISTATERILVDSNGCLATTGGTEKQGRAYLMIWTDFSV